MFAICLEKVVGTMIFVRNEGMKNGGRFGGHVRVEFQCGGMSGVFGGGEWLGDGVGGGAFEVDAGTVIWQNLFLYCYFGHDHPSNKVYL